MVIAAILSSITCMFLPHKKHLHFDELDTNHANLLRSENLLLATKNDSTPVPIEDGSDSSDGSDGSNERNC